MTVYNPLRDSRHPGHEIGRTRRHRCFYCREVRSSSNTDAVSQTLNAVQQSFQTRQQNQPDQGQDNQQDGAAQGAVTLDSNDVLFSTGFRNSFTTSPTEEKPL